MLSELEYARREALRGGNPRDTFSAYGLDYKEVMEWALAIPFEMDREGYSTEELIAVFLMEGLATGIALEKRRQEKRLQDESR